MNFLLLWNNSAPVLHNINREDRMDRAVAFEDKTALTSASDLAWQNAMEHARQAEPADWFKPLQARDPSASPSSQRAVDAVSASASSVAQLRSQAATEVVTGMADSNDRVALSGNLGSEGDTLVDNTSSQLSARSPAAKFLSSALADALSAEFGSTVMPASSLDDFSGMSVGDGMPISGAKALSEMSADALFTSLLNPSDSQEASAEHPPRSQAASGATAASDSGAPSREPVRLYSEWTQEGVRIWLGADNDQKLPLTQLTQHLQQWLTGQGESLVTLVYNGRMLWSRDANSVPRPATEFSKQDSLSALPQFNHQELPWQSVQ